MESEGLTPAPIFKGLVRPILVAGIERPLFWGLITVSASPLVFAANPIVMVFCVCVAIVLIAAARFVSAGDEQTFEIFLDALRLPTSLDAHSGYNAKSAEHPRYK
jgi:type IV secretory pathway VirB3-like protein